MAGAIHGLAGGMCAQRCRCVLLADAGHDHRRLAGLRILATVPATAPLLKHGAKRLALAVDWPSCPIIFQPLVSLGGRVVVLGRGLVADG